MAKSVFKVDKFTICSYHYLGAHEMPFNVAPRPISENATAADKRHHDSPCSAKPDLSGNITKPRALEAPPRAATVRGAGAGGELGPRGKFRYNYIYS